MLVKGHLGSWLHSHGLIFQARKGALCQQAPRGALCDKHPRDRRFTSTQECPMPPQEACHPDRCRVQVQAEPVCAVLCSCEQMDHLGQQGS